MSHTWQNLLTHKGCHIARSGPLATQHNVYLRGSEYMHAHLSVVGCGSIQMLMWVAEHTDI